MSRQNLLTTGYIVARNTIFLPYFRVLSENPASLAVKRSTTFSSSLSALKLFSQLGTNNTKALSALLFLSGPDTKYYKRQHDFSSSSYVSDVCGVCSSLIFRRVRAANIIPFGLTANLFLLISAGGICCDGCDLLFYAWLSL